MSSNSQADRSIRFTPRFKKGLYWAAGLVAFYTLFGFLILPLIVKMVAVKRASKLLDREVTIEKVGINPYTFSASIRGLLIKDKDGEPMVSWDEFYANFQLISFFAKPWVFEEIRLTQPFARVQVNKDRSLNFSDLTKKFAATASPKPVQTKKRLFLRVGQLRIGGARASFSDLTPRVPFHRVVGPLEIILTDFQTDPNNNNPYSFSGTTDGGEQFSWKGHFHLDPLRSEGDLSLGGLSIAKYAELYQDLVRFDIKDGTADARSSYRVGFSASNYFASVSNASLSLRSFKVAAKDSAENLLEVDNLSVENVAADAVRRTTEVGNVSLSGARLALKRETNAAVNLFEAARPAEGATNAPGGILYLMRLATNAFAVLLQSTNLWSATLHELSLTNSVLTWEDKINSRPVSLVVDDISLKAREFSNIGGSNSALDLSFRWNTNGTVEVGSRLQISPPTADISLKLQDLELRSLDPYLEPFLNLFIVSSKVGLDGSVQMRTAANGLPEITFRGDLKLDDFGTVDSALTEDLVKWKSVQFSGVEATLTPPTVVVKEVAMIEPYAHVIVETNRLLNLLVILKAGQTNAPSSDLKSVTGTAASPPRRKAGLSQKFGSMLRGILVSNTNAAGGLLAPNINISSVVISNAHADFSDRSLQPPMTVSIQELSGKITDISSEELKRAGVQLSGKIGRTGPFEISGKINPLNQKAPTELSAKLHDVDLSPASSYSGKYLGYRLNRGKLNLEVNYEVSDRNLKAKNVIVLDQLTLGQKVASPDATTLPVRLAVAVLKDRDGKIELDVPIEGKLDDPEFRFGKVVVRAIVNIITKIATSPFAVLGSVFGGKGEEVSFQDFPPGSAELRAANLEKLALLINGLQERPGLQVEIEGSFDPTADFLALRRQKLDRAFQAQKWAEKHPTGQPNMPPDGIVLTPDERNDYLKKRYALMLQSSGAPQPETSKNASIRPAAPVGAKTGGTREKSGAPAVQAPGISGLSAPPNEMEKEVLKTITVSDDELRELARNRARRVQEKILESGRVAPERILLSDIQSPEYTNRSSRVYFHLL